MRRGRAGIELPVGGITRLVRVEFGLRHTGIIQVKCVEPAVRARGNEIAGFQLEKPLASFAAILRVFAGSFPGLFAHRLSTSASDERQATLSVPLNSQTVNRPESYHAIRKSFQASPSTLDRRSCASWAS